MCIICVYIFVHYAYTYVQKVLKIDKITSLYIYVYKYVYMCIYTYIHIIHTYVYIIHTYTYIVVKVFPKRSVLLTKIKSTNSTFCWLPL